MREDVDLVGMALFVRIVEDGSLSAAGRTLGLPKATVSRRLALLEASIGAPLLARSTRALSLTDTGRRFFERVQPIVRDAEVARSEIRVANREPSGLLRISAPVALGQGVIAPKLMEFLERYPRVQADLHFSDERVNLIAEGFDLAIRIGELADSELIGRRLADISIVLVAAPSYLAAHGKPQTVRDLKQHVAVLTQKTGDHWTIGGEMIRMSWRVSTGSMLVTRDAARGGLGIAQLPLFFVAEDLEAGRLARVLPDHDLPKSALTALYPRSVVPSPALRTLLDILPEWCGC
jgi:DNA-binding transcriptional LysR family regulator